MKSIAILAAFAALFIVGCGDQTAEEDKTDTKTTAGTTMDRMGDATADAAAATILTPRLKAAVIADDELNDSRNLINIDSDEETVTLNGHVSSGALKAKAERIVREEMDRAEAKQDLVNKLEVKETID